MMRYLHGLVLGFTCVYAQAAQTLPEEEFDCFVVPSAIAEVGSPVRGVISKILVDRGDSVREGQAIAVLDSNTERIMLDHAEARADMKSEMAARESDLELATLQLARVENMHKQRLAPTQQRDEARVRKRVAQAGLVQALENQKLIHIELQRATHDLARRTIKSPMDGVVVEQFVVPGEFIYDEPVMSIAALDSLRVEVVLPAVLFGSVQVSSDALITLELDSGHPLNATVEVVDALLDTRSGTFGVRLSLPNPDRSITAGQKCTIDFLTEAGTIELAKESE